MMRLDFSYNWNNKLNCDVFTTMRLSDRFNQGDSVDVFLKEVKMCDAVCIGKKSLLLKDINSFIAGLDTGYNTIKCQELLKTMYKNKNVNWTSQPIYLYLFKKVK